jgi:ubiquinone/menaquinone biosynthesis C-methylase UbiE
LAWMRSDSDRELFFRWLSPGAEDRVLDVGAGKGVVARRVLEAGVRDVYALEPSQKSVAAMKRNSPQLKASVSGAEKMPFPDSFFTKVYTTMALHHFSSLDRALAEVARVLVSGGTFLILDVDPSFGRGRVMRFIENGLFRRHLTFLNQAQLVEKIAASADFEVTEQSRGRVGYFVSCVRKRRL